MDLGGTVAWNPDAGFWSGLGASDFASLSSILLLFQAFVEVLQNLHQRRSPKMIYWMR